MQSKPADANIIIDAIKALNNYNKLRGTKTSAEYMEQIAIVKNECNKGLQYRVIAGKQETMMNVSFQLRFLSKQEKKVLIKWS